MRHDLQVENIKCGGCARTIEHALREDPRVSGVTVDVEHARVSIDAEGEGAREAAVRTLARLGYPEAGAAEGAGALAAKARSYVSCAIGKVRSN